MKWNKHNQEVWKATFTKRLDEMNEEELEMFNFRLQEEKEWEFFTDTKGEYENE